MTILALARIRLGHIRVAIVQASTIGARLHARIVEFKLLAELTRTRTGCPTSATRSIALVTLAGTTLRRAQLVVDPIRVVLVDNRRPVDCLLETRRVRLEQHVADLDFSQFQQAQVL